jgi:hypothetical protein
LKKAQILKLFFYFLFLGINACAEDSKNNQNTSAKQNPNFEKRLHIVKNPNGFKIYKEASKDSDFEILPYHAEFFSQYPSFIQNDWVQITWKERNYFTKEFSQNEILTLLKLDLDTENYFFTKKIVPLYEEPNTDSKIITTLPAYFEIKPLYKIEKNSKLKIKVTEFQDYQQYLFDFFRIEYNQKFYYIPIDLVEPIYSLEKKEEFESIKKINETNSLFLKSKSFPIYQLKKKENNYSLKLKKKIKLNNLFINSFESIFYKNNKYYKISDSEEEFISQNDCKEVLDPIQFSNFTFNRFVKKNHRPILEKFKEIYEKDGFFFDYTHYSVKKVPFQSWNEVYLVTVNDYKINEFESLFKDYHGHKRAMLFRKKEDSYIPISGNLATEDRLRILDLDKDGYFEMILQYQYRMLLTTKILYFDDGRFLELNLPQSMEINEIYEGGLLVLKDDIFTRKNKRNETKEIYQFKNRELIKTNLKEEDLKNKKKLFP